MIDREKLIKGLRCHLRIDGLQCKDCPYWKNIRNTCICEKEIEVDALSLLKEQDELLRKKQKDIDRLCNEISEWKHKYHDKLLKEQEAVEPTWQEGKAFC